jgi:hypothetical protein
MLDRSDPKIFALEDGAAQGDRRVWAQRQFRPPEVHSLEDDPPLFERPEAEADRFPRVNPYPRDFDVFPEGFLSRHGPILAEDAQKGGPFYVVRIFC